MPRKRVDKHPHCLLSPSFPCRSSFVTLWESRLNVVFFTDCLPCLASLPDSSTFTSQINYF